MPQSKEIPDSFCTRKDLEGSFRALGLFSGMTLMVHSSLKSLGWVPGGARSVVDALLAILGPDGTLVMPGHSGDNSDPAYWRQPPVPEAWWPEIRASLPPFDPALTPCVHMGAVADCFRAYPGVRRSNHPTHSFLAKGPKAAAILARHDLDFSLGENSPCSALDRDDAWVLLLGVDFDRCTIMHLAEYRSQCRTTLQQGSAIGKDGRQEFANFRDLDLESDDFLNPGREMEAAGQVRRHQLGQAELRLFRVRDAVQAAEKWLSRNRMRRLGENDRPRILEYLSHEPEYNLFLLGDIENFSLAADFMDVMAFEKDGSIDSVLLRYNHSFIPYSQNPDFELAPVLAALQTPNLGVLSGKQAVIDRLRPHLDGFKWRSSYLMKLGREDLDAAIGPDLEPDGVVLCRLAEDDVPDLVDFIDKIAEFVHLGPPAERIREIRNGIKSGASHYYAYAKDGQLLTVAGTTAENSLSAMVVSVATRPDWRGRGLASRLVATAARDRLDSGLKYLCLFYDNPTAGRIYRRLGFRDAGLWAMAVPLPPIPAKEDDFHAT